MWAPYFHQEGEQSRRVVEDSVRMSNNNSSRTRKNNTSNLHGGL